jgi:branched-chain amino acid aminotransferase/para-aminobenzoate synthetase component 1
VSAQRYHPPDEELYRRGWHLKVFSEGFSPPLAGHKTLNYLYFCMARQSALDAGADEAIIMDPSGSVSETSAGSLLAKTHGRWWTPESSYRLPGITLRRMTTLMQEAENPIEVRRTTVEDLISAQSVWVLNSLMLIMPVSMVEGRTVLDCSADEASRFRSELVRRGNRDSKI